MMIQIPFIQWGFEAHMVQPWFCTLCCTLRKYNSLRDDFEARIDLEAGRVGREATDEGDSKERSVSDDWSNGSIQWTGDQALYLCSNQRPSRSAMSSNLPQAYLVTQIVISFGGL